MFRIYQLSRFQHRLLLLLLPVFCIGLIPIILIRVNPKVMRAAERERAITQLRSVIERADGKPTDEQLLVFERNYPKSRAASLARFLRAYLHFTNGDFSGSAPLFDESFIKEGTELGDYALYYQGRAYHELGDDKRARDAFSQLAERYPQSILRREALLAAAESSLKLDEPKAALKTVSKLVEAKDAGALLIAAHCYEKLNNVNEAVNSYRKIYYEVPASNESDEAATRLTALGFKPPEAGKEGYKLQQTRADRLFEAGQFVRSCDAFTILFNQFPDLAAQPRNNLRFGISLYNQGRYREALKPLLAVQADQKELYPDALYYTAQSYRRQKLMKQFATTADQALSKYLAADRAADLLAGLIAYYDDINESTAEDYRARLIKDYPQTKQADEASFRTAWQFHTQKKYEQSSKALLEHLVNFPDSDWRGSSAFWAATDAEKAGNSARAAAIYEVIPRRYRYGYYGYLANNHLTQLKKREKNLQPEQPAEGSLLARALAVIKPAAPLPETATDKAVLRLQRAENLKIIDLGDLALAELEAARQDAPNSPSINLEIARIYRARGDNLKAVLALQRAHPDYLSYQGNEATREVFEIFFPLIEWNTIKTESARYGLDPYIVAGLIRQESVFDPRAKSRANALGLMQLLPSTGKLVAKKQGSGPINAEQLYNPQLNIKLGVAYLSELINRFGRVEYATAAYNGGPGRVDRWKQTLPEDLEDWVEAIPITETRFYVQGVIRNAAHYRRLYAE